MGKLMQQACRLKDAGIGRGEADDAKGCFHRENPAAGDQGCQRCIRGIIANHQHTQQIQKLHALHHHRQQGGGKNAEGHRDLYRNLEEGQHHDQYCRRKKPRAEDKVLGKNGTHILRGRNCGRKMPQQEIDYAGKAEGDEGGFYHPFDVSVDVGFRHRAYQQGAGRHGGAAITKGRTGEYCAADQNRGQAHAAGEGSTDDTHGRGRSKGCSRKKRDKGAEKERGEDHNVGRTQRRGMIDDVGDDAGGPPRGGDHTDQNEDQQHIFRGHNAAPCHLQCLLYRIAAGQGIAGKQEKAENQREKHAFF